MAKSTTYYFIKNSILHVLCITVCVLFGTFESLAQTKVTNTNKPGATKKKVSTTKKIAQEDNKVFSIALRPYSDSIAIRWATSDYSIWLKGLTYGYDLYRGVITGSDTSELTKVNDEPIRPVSSDEFKEKYFDDPLTAKAMFTCLYSDSADSDINEALLKEQTRNMAMVMSLLSANLHPKIAKISGLMFVDKNVVKGKNYVYVLRLNQKSKTSLFASNSTVCGSEYQIAPISGFNSEVKKRTLKLTWHRQYVGTDFSYFDIYRSESADKGFEKLNDIPYVSVTSEGQDPFYADYGTEIPNTSKTYFYKIKGFTPFGDSTDWSPMIEIRAKQSLFDYPVITSMFSLDNKSVQIVWELEDPLSKKNVVGYFVQRTNEPVDGARVFLNQKPVKITSFSDPNPLKAGFYRVLALGTAGDTTYSLFKSIELIDSIPPEAPIVLEAKLDTNRIVTIRWEASKATDLFAYKVLRNYSGRSDYYLLTKSKFNDTLYYDTIPKGIMERHVRYKVQASDYHDNVSKDSKIIFLTFPDKTPPEAPLFLKTKNVLGKIELGWFPSGSSDVIKTELLRKQKYDYDWQTLVLLDSVQSYTVRSYADTNVKPKETYLYVLRATDWVGNVSNSSILEIKAERPLYMPDVRELKAIPAQANNFIKLSWQYSEEGLKSFTIYRKSAVSNLTQLATIPANLREYYDKNVQPSSEYTYYIQAHFDDFSSSKMKGPLEVKY